MLRSTCRQRTKAVSDATLLVFEVLNVALPTELGRLSIFPR